MDKQFISITTWAAILLISFGMLGGKIENGWVSWFFFSFFVVAKIFQWFVAVSERLDEEKRKFQEFMNKKEP